MSNDTNTEMDSNTLHKTKNITDQGLSRLILGDIGNRVSALKIDAPAAIKKEILPPEESILTKVHLQAKSNVFSFTNKQSHKEEISLKCKTHVVHDSDAVKVEYVPDANSLPQVLLHRAQHEEFIILPDGAPMDVSGDTNNLAIPQDCFHSPIEDIDAEDEDNPQLVSVYVNSIFSYMRDLELKFDIQPNYLDGQEVTGKMRAILVDWLCQVHSRFRLLQETLFLTVAIIDRYLQVRTCKKNRLQLVGVTAMLVASKYEEMFAPEVADFVYITDNAYTKQEVRSMEQEILRALDFSFGRPHCLHFLRRNSKAGQVDATKHTLAKYLMELTITEYSLVHVKPSILAAAALYLSILLLEGTPQWTATLIHYSTYCVQDILPLVSSLARLVVKSETSKQQAVRTKYAGAKFMKISTIPQLKSKILLELSKQSDIL